MIINFQCRECETEFDCDVGIAGINAYTMRPEFEKSINCPQCGKREIDEVLLTTLGQHQLTQALWQL